jgi:biotin carboxylase
VNVVRDLFDEPLLIVYGSGGRLYREYLVRSAAQRYGLWLMTTAQPTWQLPYLVGYTVVDTLSPDSAIRAAVELADQRPVAGVWCYDEVRLCQAAEVATALDRPTSPPDAVLACRDKRLSRARLDAAGVPQARSICVADLPSARVAAAEIGYPVIVKPRGLAGSEGVVLVRREDDLAEGVAAALRADFAEVPRFDEGLLVEEYLDGPEISIDAVVLDGAVRPLFIARKQLDHGDTFEETGHAVSAGDPLLTDPVVCDVLTRAHAALGSATE